MNLRSTIPMIAVLWLGPTAVYASPPVVRGPGEGFYEAKSLRGPAAPAVFSYLARTYVPCTDSKNGAGVCNLRASTESLSLLYAGEYAVAIVAFDGDTGNHPAVRVAMWHRAPGGYEFLGAKDDAIGLVSSVRSTGALGDGMALAGIIQGPNDSFCCPTKKATYSVTYSDGRLVVASGARHRSAMN